MAFDWVTPRAIAHFKNLPQPVYAIGAEYDFAWWYAYFWKEAKGAGAPDDRYRELLDMIYRDPEVNVAALGFRAANDARTNAAINVIRADMPIPANLWVKRRILAKLLDMGFRAMVPAGMLRSANDTRDFFRYQIRYDDAVSHRRIPVSIGFRGEGRPYDRVIAHNGALNRVDLHLLNMDQTWHPFSDPAIGGRLYFRRTSGDNCLYSVTSVGDDIDVAIGFPLIEDEALYRWPAKRIERWTRNEHQQARASGVFVVKIRLFTGGRLLYGYTLGTENYIYMFKVTGDAVHTQRELGGDQCRERGVRGVPLNDFMAGVRVRRIHFGPTRGHGIYGIVQAVKYYVGGGAWADNATAQQVGDFHFDGDRRAGETFLGLVDRTFATPPHLEGEVIAPNQPLRIAEVRDWDVAYDTFQADIRNPEVHFIPTAP